ncbi:hypothetical protein ACFLZ3_03545 [Candidatus Omnitrophota bacterium]
MPRRSNKDKLIFTVGGINVSIRTIHPALKKRLERYYKAFLSRQKPDINISTTIKDFPVPDKERFSLSASSWQLSRDNGLFRLYFPQGKRHSLAEFSSSLKQVKLYCADNSAGPLLYLLPSMLVGLKLIKNDGLILHACAVFDSRKAYLFIAPSGGGKSTIAGLALKEGLKVLNYDRIILRRQKRSFKIYANPWHGEVKSVSNRSYAIREIFFLEKSASHKITPVSKTEALVELCKNSIYLPLNYAIIKKRFRICCDFAQNLKCYRLGFKPDKSLWRFLNAAIK